jgi:hypothetical protein
VNDSSSYCAPQHTCPSEKNAVFCTMDAKAGTRLCNGFDSVDGQATSTLNRAAQGLEWNVSSAAGVPVRPGSSSNTGFETSASTASRPPFQAGFDDPHLRIAVDATQRTGVKNPPARVEAEDPPGLATTGGLPGLATSRQPTDLIAGQSATPQ